MRVKMRIAQLAPMDEKNFKKLIICLDNDRYNEYYSGMSGRLSQEIKQTKPFSSLETEAILNVQRTADEFGRALTEALKPMDISPTQYNALRILQGAGPAGWSCSEIAERMVTRDPDITRLIDRLEKRGLVQRARGEKDRRVVTVRITPQGSRVLAELAPMLAGLERKLLGHLGADRLKTFIDLLEEARAGAQ
ncbi:MAG TPA: MarR family transcriptional regulator [Planctomycetota bacterium]|nr:MarR family transcriptional regulator [Planctomycetota bacterium]